MSEENGNLFERLERDALFSMPEDDAGEEELDVVRALTGAEVEASDLTLGGYIEKHDRVPAFEGADGQPYTVDIVVEETGDPERRWVAFLIFLRWAATGAGIMGHLESGDVARGDTEEAARQAARELTLYEIRSELDAAIERRRELERED
ncbi:MAG: hypothetical protein GX539_11355 [Candidatus Cloacimonetes bacterium]|nr:hypothetical protein [Candidatus Cloacimonadota bacterium]